MYKLDINLLVKIYYWYYPVRLKERLYGLSFSSKAGAKKD